MRIGNRRYSRKRGVDVFVAVGASVFNRDQQDSGPQPQLIPGQSLALYRISTAINKCRNLVRDQGVGGSNPLSPTRQRGEINAELHQWDALGQSYQGVTVLC